MTELCKHLGATERFQARETCVYYLSDEDICTFSKEAVQGLIEMWQHDDTLRCSLQIGFELSTEKP